MQKINERELENIIRDVINEQVMMEDVEEGVWGGIKGAAKQVGSDIKNAWNNMKQAYKYGSQAQDINKKYPTKQTADTTNNTTKQPQSNQNIGAPPSTPQTQDTATQSTPKKTKGGNGKPKQNAGQQQSQPQQQKPRSNRQADFRINPMRVSQGNRMIKQTVQQLISNYGLNYEQVYNTLINAANDVKKNRNEYFPQTNESILSNEDMERLTEDIVARIRKG